MINESAQSRSGRRTQWSECDRPAAERPSVSGPRHAAVAGAEDEATAAAAVMVTAVGEVAKGDAVAAAAVDATNGVGARAAPVIAGVAAKRRAAVTAGDVGTEVKTGRSNTQQPVLT